MTRDYKSTVFLPRTDFPMRAGLPQKEPDLLRRWDEMDLYARLRAESRGRPRFVLHDGPPYANGNIHVGHAVNKILKDVINRAHQMLGRDAPYVPGWDCHGLPIEWKIEEKYRAAGKDKDEVPVLDFRAECRAFADHWVGVQTEEFKRLGVLGDWKRPYMTMTLGAEAQIVREIHKFLMNGGLYKGAKPVMWSTVEKTALAEAEVEYHDHTSDTVWVRFPVVSASDPALDGAEVVIWTTTPWTLPGNRAIAFGEGIEYGVYEVTAAQDGALAAPGARLVVAADLWEATRAQAKVEGREVARLPGSALAGTVAAHPLRGSGYDFDVPLLAGEFVEVETGTGFVHIAPGHGVDDFELGRRHGIAVPDTVADDGSYLPQVPLFAGRFVFTPQGRPGDANGAVMAAMQERGRLLARSRIVHSYPHSWRSKAPVIFRATPQWFISMEANGLRETALAAIEATTWVPPQGQNRIGSIPEVPGAWRDDALARRWEAIRAVRRVVTGALERERAAKTIGSSLQAAPVAWVPDAMAAALEGVDLAEVAITSGIRVERGPAPDGAFALPDVPDVGVVFERADGEKCERCWKVLPEVGRAEEHPGLCLRCADAVAHLPEAAQ